MGGGGGGDFVLMLRLMNHNDRLDDVHIFWIWMLNDRLSLTSTPNT